MIDDINLPIKKTEGETMQDRMSKNAYERILPARYLMRDENGETKETQEEIFERVAKNVALAEAVYEAERQKEQVMVNPNHIKESHSKRDKLVEEVFGERVHPEDADDDMEVVLDEWNVNKFSYDNLVPDLPEGVKNHVEKIKNDFQEHMEYLKWTPNSPTLMNAGDELQQLSACFVMSPDDDMEDIHEKAKQASLVFQSGGGCGYGFWKLRPKGDRVGSSGGVASGPISFMRVYDEVCGTVAQAGKRRGAQMGVMRVDHPDIIEFIHSKDKDVSLAHTLLLNDPDDFTHNEFRDALDEAKELINSEGKVEPHLRNAAEGHLSNFNISVGITDDFMEAVKNDETFTFTNPRTGDEFVANQETVKMYETYGLGDYVEVGEVLEVPAEELWEDIMEGAHENGEPGVVFLERMNKESAFDPEENPDKRVYSTNPCGEQELFDYDACNLSHINLSTILDEECDIQDYREFRDKMLEDIGNSSGQNVDESQIVNSYLEQVVDWEDLDERIKLNTRFLDNVVTMSDFPVEKIEQTTHDVRKIGLGVMGYAQMLFQMGVPYGSSQGDEIARQLMNYINRESVDESRSLAVDDKPGKERGVFDDWQESKWSEPMKYKDWFEREAEKEAESYEDGFPVRNHSHTTVAPTGTTSMIGNTTGGCEPVYSVANYKNVSEDIQGDEMLVQFDDFFLRVLENNDINIKDVKKECEEMMENNQFDGVQGLETVPDKIGEIFVTTSDLEAIEHASVQCAFQEGVSSSISKTINAPNDASVEDTREAFEYVYDNGGKGVTYYRDGTRNKQVLTTRKQNKQFAEDDELLDAVRKAIDEDEEVLDDLMGVIIDMSDEDKLVLERASVRLASELEEVNIDEQRPSGEQKMNVSEYRKRSDILSGATIRVTTGYGSLYVTLNEDENGDLFEVICEIGKSGGLKSSFTESLGRMISMSLRYGVPPERIIKHMSGIKSPKTTWNNGDTIHSIPDGIAYALQEYVNKGGVVGIIQEQRNNLDKVDSNEKDVTRDIGDVENKCPKCGAGLIYPEGCEECEEGCGYSKC